MGGKNPTTVTWTSGVTADFDIPADWGGDLPQSGDTADIPGGSPYSLVQITSGDAPLLSGVTFGVGALQPNVWVTPTSDLQVIDANLPSSLIIDDVSSGGTMSLDGSSAVMGSGLVATGSVTSQATINVGAGDLEDLEITGDAPGKTGYFDNLGAIKLAGSATNYASLDFCPLAGGSGGAASYGAINLSYGFMVARAPDALDASNSNGQITLGDGSYLIATARVNLRLGTTPPTATCGPVPKGCAPRS